jgi:hypothetical protein
MSKIKANLHYVIPVVALLIANFIYFYPALQGKVLEQDDIMLGYAKGKEIRDYRENEKEEPLWTQAMFSGMPAFQISTQYPNNWTSYVQKLVSFVGGKTSNVYIIFSLMLGFYILMTGLKVNPWLSAIGALAFAFSAYFIISFGAGHNAKVRTAAYIAPVVLGVIMAYRGKLLAGLAITALSLGIMINSNHPQITYYLGILLLIIAIVEFVFAYREKQLVTFWKASGILVVAAVLAIGPNISNLWSTYEYTKETMRGGSSELSAKKTDEGGLDWEYAMNWSYGIAETFNLIIADFTGGGSAQTYEGTQIHDQYYNNYVSSLTSRGTPKAQAEKQVDRFMGGMFYWGEQSLVNGGYYVGAVVFFFFVFGLFFIKGRIKWWVAIATALLVMMAWGKYFPLLNEFLFYNLPLYNKFRVPSYTFTIAFFTLPFLGFLALNQVLKGDYNKAQLKKQLLNSFYITGGLCLFFIALGPVFFNMESARDAQLAQSGIDVDMLLEDRASLMRKSAFKTFIFCGLSFGLLWFYVQGKVKKNAFFAVLALLVIADQWSFVKQHVGSEDFVSQRSYESAFAKTPANQTILQDNDPHFRVWNTTAGLTSDSYTSYYHKSIGGYHGAKLIRYQDLIENQLSQQNMACFNMLNAKWVIVGDKQTGQQRAQQNPEACGASWFVKNIQTVADADAEMAALKGFNPKETAIVDQRYSASLPNISNASEGSIKLTSYDPKHMVYEANAGNSEQFAVFSEIYYEGGNNDWKTYIDKEEASHIRVNYLLRGMTIPSGKHTIEFKFEPRSYYMGEKIALVFSVLLLATVILSLFMLYKRKSTTV